MTDVSITAGSLTIRSVSNDDAELLLSWLSDPQVLEFYGGRDKVFTLDLVRDKYLSSSEASPVSRCIVSDSGTPVGYVQFYSLDEATKQAYRYPATVVVFGMDQFLGGPSNWGRGVGSRMVMAAVDYLVSEGVDVITVDPRLDNKRAIRAYEKCGFKQVKVLSKHEEHEGVLVDCCLMERRLRQHTTQTNFTVSSPAT